MEDGEQCLEKKRPGDLGKGRGKSTGDRTKHGQDSRVLSRWPRQKRQLIGSSVHVAPGCDMLLERRGWAIFQHLINKHLLQDKGTHWNRIRPNWGQNVR